MREKLEALVKKLQKEGIPLLFFRDPVRKAPSVSLTLLLVSFGKLVEGVDDENSLQLLIICASLYFGRTLSSKMRE